jgi:hypothetical protein
MSSLDLVASIKALNLGRSKEERDSEPEQVMNDKPIAKLELVTDPRIQKNLNEKPTNLPRTKSGGIPFRFTAQNATSGAVATLRNPKHRRRRRKGSESNPKINIASSKVPDLKIQDGLGNIPQPQFAYVVQISTNSGQKIIGVFTSLSKANNAALDCASQSGIVASDIVDIVSSFAFAGPKPKRAPAKRRTWSNGTSEIQILDDSSQLKWIKVLAKGVDGLGSGDFGVAYLALDNSFVVGVFRTEGEAWQACQKYSAQLSYCSEIENKDHWVDDQGMNHTKGIIGGATHHWFVKLYNTDEKIKY